MLHVLLLVPIATQTLEQRQSLDPRCTRPADPVTCHLRCHPLLSETKTECWPWKVTWWSPKLHWNLETRWGNKESADRHRPPTPLPRHSPCRWRHCEGTWKQENSYISTHISAKTNGWREIGFQPFQWDLSVRLSLLQSDPPLQEFHLRMKRNLQSFCTPFH